MSKFRFLSIKEMQNNKLMSYIFNNKKIINESLLLYEDYYINEFCQTKNSITFAVVVNAEKNEIIYRKIYGVKNPYILIRKKKVFLNEFEIV